MGRAHLNVIYVQRLFRLFSFLYLYSLRVGKIWFHRTPMYNELYRVKICRWCYRDVI